jgi:3-hydroxybutyryl-CoA dehydrogenase
VSQPNPTERLGIVGSGAIGCGLAAVAAPHLDTVLWARSDSSAERARAKLNGSGEVVTDLDALAESTVVIEAVAEDMAIKGEILGRLHALLDDDSLLASTTSSLSVNDLAEASGRPDRFAAVHVFNPVDKMDLVELAFPDEASASARQRLRELCDLLGKTAVEVPVTPGFVVNRLLFPYLFSAVRLLEAETALEPKAVDECMKLGAGHPMGPLAVLDFVGLDVAAAIGDSIGVEVPERVRTQVAEGRLGRKSGAGFYDY